MNKITDFLLKYSQWIVVFMCLILLDYKYELVNSFNNWLNSYLIIHNFEPINIWQILLPKEFVVDLFTTIIEIYYFSWNIFLFVLNLFFGFILFGVIKWEKDILNPNLIKVFTTIWSLFKKLLVQKYIATQVLIFILVYFTTKFFSIIFLYYTLLYLLCFVFFILNEKSRRKKLND